MNQQQRQSIPKTLRELVKNKFEGRCGYCGDKAIKLHVDHIKPFAGGGTNAIENLMPACAPCNNFKTSFTLEQFRYELSEQVSRARRYSVNFRIAERFGLVKVSDIEIVFYFERHKNENA